MKLFLIVKFAYNNIKNVSIGHIPFKLNCNYYLCVLYKKDVDSRSKSKSVNELATKLKNLITVYKNNLQHAHKLQK